MTFPLITVMATKKHPQQQQWHFAFKWVQWGFAPCFGEAISLSPLLCNHLNKYTYFSIANFFFARQRQTMNKRMNAQLLMLLLRTVTYTDARARARKNRLF